jgi:hypothetical protein
LTVRRVADSDPQDVAQEVGDVLPPGGSGERALLHLFDQHRLPHFQLTTSGFDRAQLLQDLGVGERIQLRHRRCAHRFDYMPDEEARQEQLTRIRRNI